MKSISYYKNLRLFGYVGLVVSLIGLVSAGIYLVPTIFLNAICGLYSNSCLDINGPVIALIVSALALMASIASITFSNNKLHQLEINARKEKRLAE